MNILKDPVEACSAGAWNIDALLKRSVTKIIRLFHICHPQVNNITFNCKTVIIRKLPLRSVLGNYV